MTVTVTPRKIKGRIRARASKSYAQRIIIASAFCHGPTRIENFDLSKDINASLSAVNSLGAKTLINDNILTVFPIEKKNDSVFINSGECGTTARIILPCACALYKEGILSGEGSLLSRPFEDLVNCLTEKGVEFSSSSLPIKFRADMQEGVYKLNPAKSSQFLSGLLFALPLLEKPTSIELTSDISSVGYVDMTRKVLSRFGIKSYLYYDGSEEYISPEEIEIEGDASNSAFFSACGIKVDGVPKDSLQKDIIFDTIKDDLYIDAKDIPDLVPILSVYATTKEKDTTIGNINRLRLKESDRIESIVDMITALGGEIKATENEITIHGSKGLRGGIVNSHNDHRIVMSSVIASQFCTSDVTITGAEAVEKSYPQFFSDFVSLGGEIYVK